MRDEYFVTHSVLSIREMKKESDEEQQINYTVNVVGPLLI